MNQMITVDGFRTLSIRKQDRRKKASFLNPYLFRGRRKNARRTNGSQDIYVDQFTKSEYGLILFILFLTILDGVFTSYHLAQGARELNPLLDMLYQTHKLTGLMLTKFALTLPCLFFILIHIRFSKALTGAKFLAFIYGALTVYHILGFFFV